MLRDWILFYEDLIEFCQKVLAYTDGLSREQFEASDLNYDAAVWNVHLFGEAAKNIPAKIRDQMPEIPWRELIDMRNKLSRGYFGINNDILWDVIRDKVPKLLTDLRRIQAERPHLFEQNPL